MARPPHPLPANRVFLIQLRAGKGESEIRHGGRIEHLSSGQAARFDREDELWAFIDGTLTEVIANDRRDRSRQC